MEKRNTKTDFLIAFWTLYEKKQIETISIRELCQLAGYNRTTFYVYYENIYDLLDQAIDDMLTPLKETLQHVNELNTFFGSQSMEALLLKIFPSTDKYIELLFKRQHYLLLSDKIKKELLFLLKQSLNKTEEDMQALQLILEYQVSAAFGAMKYWIETGKIISEETFIKTIYHISTIGALPLLSKEIECLQEG